MLVAIATFSAHSGEEATHAKVTSYNILLHWDSRTGQDPVNGPCFISETLKEFFPEKEYIPYHWDSIQVSRSNNCQKTSPIVQRGPHKTKMGRSLPPSTTANGFY